MGTGRGFLVKVGVAREIVIGTLVLHILVDVRCSENNEPPIVLYAIDDL